MAELSSKARNRLPAREFGEPGKRAYPMPDKAHAANAEARATQMVEAGKLSGREASKIRAKAQRVLHTERPKHGAKTSRASHWGLAREEGKES